MVRTRQSRTTRSATVLDLLRVASLHAVTKHDVLPGQFEQHRIVEELVDRDVFAEAFASASLDHEFASEMSRRLGLQRADDHRFIQRIA